MDIRIKATDYDITPEVADYLDERLAHIEKFLGGDAQEARMEVELGRAEGHHKKSEYQWFAELQLSRPGMERCVARNSEPTMNAAIDNARGELMHQLRKDKTANVRKDRKDAAKIK